MNYARIVMICVCASVLSSCFTIDDTTYPAAYVTTYSPYRYDEMKYYSQIYSQGVNYREDPVATTEVTVPESYHVGAFHSPTRAKDRDRNWVSSQNPQGYTIELADDERAAQVAKKLYIAPKNDRMAEIKYQRDGKVYYKGLYGSYSSKEEAQNALNKLPDDLKQNAGIQNWGAIQSNVTE